MKDSKANAITKRIRLVLLTMVLTILIAGALVAMAAAVVTTDPNAFQTSISGLGTPIVIDFEDIDASPVNNSTVGRPQFNGGFYAGQGITFSNPNGDPLFIAPGGLFWNESNSLSVSNFPFESGSDTNDDLVATFSPPVIAAGFTFVDNANQLGGEFVQFIDSDGVVIQQVGLPPNFSSFRAFLGMVSVDRPIAKINIVEEANDGDDVAYDDFIFVPMGGCAPPPSGLVSWWPGDGNADDIKDGNSGVLMNGAMFAPGVADQAFSFDGVDDYVEVPHDASLDIGTGFTFDAWIKADNSQSGENLWNIVDKAHQGSGIGWTCHGVEDAFVPGGVSALPGNRSTVPGEIFCSVGSGGIFTLVGTQTNVKDGQFHHIALVWTGAELQMYLDGELKETNPLTGPVTNNTDPLRLGQNVFQGRPFRGLVDEAEIFGRGLSSSEIQAIFNVGSSGKCKNQLTALGPAKAWIGLKNSDDVGTKFDLLAEVFKNGGLIGSGQLDGVPGGSSGFNNAVLRTINSSLSSSVSVSPGDTLSVKLSVRIAVGISGHRSGTARLWLNDGVANSRFGATIGGMTSDYFLVNGFTLGTDAGPGPKKTIDIFVDRLVGGNPFKPFGTWSKTF